MLPSQRALFDIPRDVCYMNAAGWGPMPLATQEAGRAAMNRKGQPWKLAADLASTQNERARSAAAALIGAAPGDITLISSVGYGVASAGKIVEIPITFRDRTHGVSKMSQGIVQEAFVMVIKLWVKDRSGRRERRHHGG